MARTIGPLFAPPKEKEPDLSMVPTREAIKILVAVEHIDPRCIHFMESDARIAQMDKSLPHPEIQIANSAQEAIQYLKDGRRGWFRRNRFTAVIMDTLVPEGEDPPPGYRFLDKGRPAWFAVVKIAHRLGVIPVIMVPGQYEDPFTQCIRLLSRDLGGKVVHGNRLLDGEYLYFHPFLTVFCEMRDPNR